METIQLLAVGIISFGVIAVVGTYFFDKYKSNNQSY